MKKKGFTLVELIAVIVILAIIIAIAVPSYARIKNNVDKKNYENSLSLAKTAALKYTEDTNIKIVFIQELIDAGYLDEKQFANLIDPKTKEKTNLNCRIAKVTSDKGMMYVDFLKKSYVLENTNECDFNAKNEFNDYVQIIATEETPEGKEIESTKSYWTNKDVVLTYKLKKDNLNVKKVEWYRGYELIDESNYFNNKKSIKITNQNLLEQTYTVRIVVEENNEETKHETSYYVRIDKNPPVFDGDGIFTPSLNTWSRTKVYELKAHDNHSGLWGYALDCDDNGNGNYQKNNKLHFDTSGSKKICIMDFAGNVASKNVNADKIDNTDMSCTFVVSGTKGNIVSDVQWYKSDVTIVLNADKVGPSGVMLGMNTVNTQKYDSVSYNTSPNASINKVLTTNMSPQTYYGFIKNQAGTTGKSTNNPKIAIEKTIVAPVKTNATSGYDKITVIYNAGSTTSGIKTRTCYRTDASGNVLANGTVSGENCIFNVEPSSSTTTYYFKKCIESNAGNKICSKVEPVNNLGYCTAGNYNTSIINKNYTNSCGECYITTQPAHYYTYNEKYTSKYQSRDCGTSAAKSSYEACSIPSCCSIPSRVEANVYKTRKVVHDIYLKNESDSNGNTKITQYSTTCQNYNYVLKENHSVVCSGPYTNYCNSSGTCNNDSTYRECNDSILSYFRYMETSVLDSKHSFFSKATRHDSGNWHITYYSMCANGNEKQTINGVEYKCATGTYSRYKKDSSGNIHEWY